MNIFTGRNMLIYGGTLFVVLLVATSMLYFTDSKNYSEEHLGVITILSDGKLSCGGRIVAPDELPTALDLVGYDVNSSEREVSVLIRVEKQNASVESLQPILKVLIRSGVANYYIKTLNSLEAVPLAIPIDTCGVMFWFEGKDYYISTAISDESFGYEEYDAKVITIGTASEYVKKNKDAILKLASVPQEQHAHVYARRMDLVVFDLKRTDSIDEYANAAKRLMPAGVKWFVNIPLPAGVE